MSEYPEHEKLSAVSEKSQAIGGFLDFGPWTLCRYDEGTDRYWATDIQDALAEWFDIDRDALEREKRAMLAKLQEASRG